MSCCVRVSSSAPKPNLKTCRWVSVSVRESSVLMNMAREQSDHGAFMEKLLLQPSPSLHQLPLHALTFAVKDMSVLITLFQFYYLFYLFFVILSISITLLCPPYVKNSRLLYFFSFSFGLIHQFKYWVFSISSFEVLNHVQWNS